MTQAKRDSVLTTVVVVGPPQDRIGGMTSVVREHLRLPPDAGFGLVYLPMTLSTQDREPVPARIRRHVGRWSALAAIIRRSHASIVHLHTCSETTFYRSAADAILARLLGCAVILHIHGAGFDRFAASAGGLAHRFIRRTLRDADRVIALSDEWRNRVLRIEPRCQTTVIENAVSTTATRVGLPRNRGCRFLFLARMDVWKGVADLLEACVRLRSGSEEIRVVLAGPDGTAGGAEALRGAIAAHGLDAVVEYAGPVEGERKERLWSETDVLIQPSHQEGMPMAMLEALARGIPVIATSVGGVPDVITDGREGLLVPPHRPDRLADAMEALATDGDARARMATAALAVGRSRFGAARFHQDLIRLYEGLSDANAPATRMSTGASASPTPAAMTAPVASPAA